MSRASTLARAIGADGALNTSDVAGLGALATLNTVGTSQIDDSAITNAKLAAEGLDASKLTAGTLPNERLASGAAVANLGYTPVNKTGDTLTGNLGVSGAVSVNTTSAPSQGSFQVNGYAAGYANSSFQNIVASVVSPSGINATQFFGDNLDFTGASTDPDIHFGLTFARAGDERRAGVSYDIRGREQFNIWSSYGYIQFLIKSSASADGEPYEANMIQALRIANDGLVHPQKGLKPTFESAWLSISTGENRFVAHGLGRQPYIVRIYVKWDNVNDNKPWMCVGDLGVWGSNSGADYGVLAAVDNTYVALGVGEGGISTDMGVSQSGFPMDNNAMANYLATYGNGGTSDFLDTPTETAGTWSSAYYKVFAW